MQADVNIKATPYRAHTWSARLLLQGQVLILQQRVSTSVDVQKRPGNSALLTALSSNQHRRLGNYRCQRPGTVPDRIATAKILGVSRVPPTDRSIARTVGAKIQLKASKGKARHARAHHPFAQAHDSRTLRWRSRPEILHKPPSITGPH